LEESWPNWYLPGGWTKGRARVDYRKENLVGVSFGGNRGLGGALRTNRKWLKNGAVFMSGGVEKTSTGAGAGKTITRSMLHRGKKEQGTKR